MAMTGSRPQPPATRLTWWHPPTWFSPITAFPNSCGRSAGQRARAHRRARRRPADPDVRRSIPDRHARGVLERVPARHHGARRSRRRAVAAIARTTPSFLAVTHGPHDVLWLGGASLHKTPVFPVK